MNFMGRSYVGIGIGGVIVLGFIATIIYIIVVLCEFKNLSPEDVKENEDVLSASITLLYIILVICVIAVFISALLIVGIVKKRHKLMRPWLLCAISGIACHSVRLIIGFFSGIITDIPLATIFSSFISGVLTLGIQMLIFSHIYKLYKDIRDKDIETITEHEEDGLNTNPEDAAFNANLSNDNPPSYSDLQSKGQLQN